MNMKYYPLIPLPPSAKSFGNAKPFLALGCRETVVGQIWLVSKPLANITTQDYLIENPPKCSIRDTFLSSHNPKQCY